MRLANSDIFNWISRLLVWIGNGEGMNEWSLGAPIIARSEIRSADKSGMEERRAACVCRQT